MPDVQLIRHQEDFVFSTAKYPAICGGLGSGKTRAGTLRAVIKLLERPGNNVGFFLPTYDLLKLRAMPGVEEDLSALGIPYTVNRSDYRINVPGYGFIIFRSYDTPGRIIAFEVAHSICDELDTLKKDQAALVWRKIAERTRQETNGPNTIGMVTTPDQGYGGFAYSRWVKNATPEHHLIKARTMDNVFLPDDYVQQIRENYDPVLADMYLNGEFVSLARHKVYSFFDRQKHHIPRTIQPGERLHIGLDFNIGGCCAVAFVIEDNKPVAVDEFVSNDTQDFCNTLTFRYKGHSLTVYPDASGKAARTNAASSDLDIITQAGFQVDAPRANPAVRDRVNAVNALFGHDRMLVNTDKCPEFTNALEMQGYSDKGEPEKFNDHPAIDDWNDAAGYFIHRKYPINRPVIYTGIGSAH